MRRALLLAAAALLGSGCIVHNDNSCARTITVTWNGFTRGDGAVLTCGQAGVDGVDIYMNGQPVSTWNCSDLGATITGVQPGTYTLDVEGIQSGNPVRILYRDSFTVNSSACGDQLVQAQPAAGDVEVQYSFASSNVCTAGSFIWFSVFDQIANTEVVRVDNTTTPRKYTCGDPAGIVFQLPVGAYDLSWTEEAAPTSATTYAVTGANCTPANFTVAGAQFTPVPVVLADVPPAAACL